MWVLIVGMTLVNLAVYTSVVQGDNAVDLKKLACGPGHAEDSPPTQENLTPAQRAERDASGELPGCFVPTQGIKHLAGGYPPQQRVPFCAEERVSNSCYASNPPTSGLHLGVERDVTLEDGNRINIPPDPGVYAFMLPRESLPHIEEHAGVYIGYNCGPTSDCASKVERLKDLVTQEISLGARVVVSPDSDLDEGTIGMAAWTRVDVFPASDYDDDRVRDFIKAHSCRFDPEGFCANAPLN